MAVLGRFAIMPCRPLQNAAELPAGLEPYRQTDVFTEDSIPAGLRKDHCTKSGVWGLIQVAEGRLRYCVTDPRRVGVELILTPESRPAVVEPEILHHVVSLGPVRFHVQFYRQPVESVPLCRFEELATRENQRRGDAAATEPQD